MFNKKSILVTGGTGSFGQKFVEIVLNEHKPRKLIVFSRDELKQHKMREKFPSGPSTGSPMRYFIGDVRDLDRLRRAFADVDIVVHAAAMKQVPACEYNPFEAVLTNVNGAKNVIDAAIDQGVKKVIALSTDKAVNPLNIYGATKLCAEKLFVHGNSYASTDGPFFSCTRYGNVIGSSGSVIPTFLHQRNSGKVTVTDVRMSRFWITLDQGVRFVLNCLKRMQGAEIFIPKIPSMNIMDLVEAIAPGCEINLTGIRAGEKLHEILLSEDEARRSQELDDMFVVRPEDSAFENQNSEATSNLADGFRLASNENSSRLSITELREFVKPLA